MSHRGEGRDGSAEHCLAHLGAMASVMSHELRNALSGIGSAVEVLGRTFPDGSEERFAVREIRQRITGLTQMAQELSRLAPRRAPRRSDISVRMLLEEVARQLGGAQAIAAPEAILLADASLLSCALARLASDLERPLRLEARREEDGIELRIEGARRCAQRPLEGFSTDRERSGELGRAIARLVIEAHGGELGDEPTEAPAVAIRLRTARA